MPIEALLLDRFRLDVVSFCQNGSTKRNRCNWDKFLQTEFLAPKHSVEGRRRRLTSAHTIFEGLTSIIATLVDLGTPKRVLHRPTAKSESFK